MRKLFIIVVLHSFFATGQIGTTPAQVTRPTPSVASLMNFNDIPVNLYSGVPDISIPVYNFPTRSKDINFNIGLKYHPAGISMIDKASDVGLGWSLFCGGVITRTIVNEPDGVYDNISNPFNFTSEFNDIYNFNFMGNSGSFLLKRNTTTNAFSVQIKEDGDAKLKIEYAINSTTLYVDSFTIYDNKGYKYVFDSYDINVSNYTHFNGVNSSSAIPVSYRSAHHLTKVYDNNGEELINLGYSSYNTNTTGTSIFDNAIQKPNEILVKGIGKAIFSYSSHPLEKESNDILRLDNIIIKNLNNLTINKYSLLFTSATISNYIGSINLEKTRRLLSGVDVGNGTLSDMDYALSYKGLPEGTVMNDYVAAFDDFGFLNLSKNCDVYNGLTYTASRKVTPAFSGYCVLEKMRYPTGGSAVFDFESNTYSATDESQGDIDDEDFYLYNPIHNVTPTVIASTNYNTSVSHTFQFVITHAKRYYFKFSHTPYSYPPEITPPNNDPLDVAYVLTGDSLGANNNLNFNGYIADENICIGKSLDLLPGTYTITMTTAGNLNTTGTISVTEYVNNSTLKRWLYGAGVRVKQIAYFDTDMSQDYFNKPSLFVGYTPSRHLKYYYNTFIDLNKSSGFLAYGRTNGLDFLGSEIGYTNVKVAESPANGYELFTYASPFESAIVSGAYWPHLLAYRSGNLKKKETFNKFGNRLTVTDNLFEYVQDSNDSFEAAFGSYNTRSSWAKLTSSTNTSYFYPSTYSIQTTETYTYNSSNKQLASKTFFNSLGEDIVTDYTYDTGNSTFSQNRISEIKSIKTSKNGSALSSSEIEYGFSLPNNSSYLPKTIRTSKDSQNFEDRVYYNLYDEFSNPLEVQQAGGTVTSYIWGYNKTQPIAKIENATNAQITAALGISVTAADESNLSLIDALRTSLPNSMITTYSYEPLIGINTITDPKGDKLTYVYDDFNRLKWVKDKDNNILTENQYDYRVGNAPLNFVQNIIYKEPTTTSITSPTVTQATINKTFFDGLGRPIQQIAHAQSNIGNDIITHIEYDDLGRKTKDYLPYATSTASLAYNANAKTQLLAYTDYVGQTPYSEKALEASPLNKVLKQGAPGNAWAINPTGADHSIKLDYQTNIDNDGVRFLMAYSNWDPSLGLFDSALADWGTYPVNELYKSITKNENWTSGDNNTTQEFKDKEGHVILKRSFGVSVVSGVEVNTIHDTYYVYDQYGNLTYVLPPLADGLIDQDVLDNLCYQYKYDYRNRLVEKKSPGKQWEYIVYDKLDRVIATGPTLSPFTNSAPNTYGWTITKFDAFGRNILTAWATGTNSSAYRKTLQNNYDTTVNPLFETKATSSTTVNNVSFNYTNLSIPTSNYHILSVNYFDDYDYPNSPTVFSNVMHDNSQAVYYNNTLKPKGLATGSWIRILESSAATPVKADESYILYDKKARPVRMRKSNYLTGYTQIDSKIDFSGKVEFTETKHKMKSGDTELYTREDFTYSDQGRLLTHIHKIGTSGTPQLLSKKKYNALGQLISKRVGGTDVTTFSGLQKVDYTYNIRGWLKSINDVTNLSEGGSIPQDLFAFKINYNEVENAPNYVGTPLYNGNIAEIYWRTKNDNIKRKYGYEYDDLNRLKNAVYQKPGAATAVTNSYNESLTYDKNGNIQTLLRNGDLDTDIFTIQIDNLVYSYDSDEPNKLLKVLDTTTHPEGFKDDSVDGINDSADDYSYDADGNMTADENKGITSVKYNHLNLPVEIVFTGNNKKIEYLYNAAGIKLKKTVTDDATVTKTYYVSGFQYTEPTPNKFVLEFFPHAEGYVNSTDFNGNNVFHYVFNFTDHLGNVRMSYTWDDQNSMLRILEENHYYPYGVKHKKYNTDTWDFVKTEGEGYNTGVILEHTAPNTDLSYQYKLNGKEWQSELGLNMYAMDMRQYDPAIGRWIVQDPIIHHDFSPYNAFDNNPAFWADPSGSESNNGDQMVKLDRHGLPVRDSWGAFTSRDDNDSLESEDGDGNSTDSDEKDSTADKNPPKSFMQWLRSLFGMPQNIDDVNEIDERNEERKIVKEAADEGIRFSKLYMQTMVSIITLPTGGEGLIASIEAKGLYQVIKESSTKYTVLLNSGNAQEFYKLLNTGWNGTYQYTKGAYSTTQFTTKAGTKVVLSTTSKSTAKATIKLIQRNGVQILMRFARP